MNKISQSGIYHKETILRDIKKSLTMTVGDKITFCQFVEIMNKDNTLRFFNRNSLLKKRRMFFKGKEKRGKSSGKEIRMPLGEFVDFLKVLAEDPKIKLDLLKFKKALIYCIDREYLSYCDF